MPGYEFDVFISYRRDGNPHEWGRNHFFDRLRRCLADHLPWKPAVFVDEEMEIGVDWPLRLQRALSRTRILVPILSAEYFQSRWCTSEWQSMVEREELLGPGLHRLIYPILYADSENFPAYARRWTWKDLKSWNSPDLVFQQTPAYVDFHKQVEEVASELATRLQEVPEWQPDWPILQADALIRPPTPLPRL